MRVSDIFDAFTKLPPTVKSVPIFGIRENFPVTGFILSWANTAGATKINESISTIVYMWALLE